MKDVCFLVKQIYWLVYRLKKLVSQLGYMQEIGYLIEELDALAKEAREKCEKKA